jgi:hypothetical protein
MEYRIFGPGRSPDDDFKGDLAAFLALNEKQRDAVAEWFLTTDSYDSWAPKLPPGIVASPLLPEQFRRAAGFIRPLLLRWQEYGLELADIERDLLLLGCAPEELAILTDFLARVSPVKGRVWTGGCKDFESLLGLPTVDDVNIVCDARPVFGGLAYDETAAENGVSYRKFVGFIHLVIMEIIASDNYGQKQRTAIQMTEETFRRFMDGMKRASEQLDILKERTNVIDPDA